MLGVANPLGAAVVDEDDVHGLGRGARLAEVGGVGGGGLSGAGTAEHALEHGQAVVVGDDLLQADGGNVELRAGGGHVGIALVGAYHDVARLGNAEVGTGHAGLGGEELVAQRQARPVGEIRGVVVAHVVADAFLLEELAHVVVAQVDGGHDNVAGLLPLQLDDALAEVGLDDLDAACLEVGVHLALLGEHRLRLHHLPNAVLLENLIDDFIELPGILRPVDDAAVLLGIGGKLIEILVEMGDGVALDLRGFLAQLFPLVESLRHVVALLAHGPERVVVPAGIVLILKECLCFLAMLCTHGEYFSIFNSQFSIFNFTALPPVSQPRA